MPFASKNTAFTQFPKCSIYMRSVEILCPIRLDLVCSQLAEQGHNCFVAPNSSGFIMRGRRELGGSGGAENSSV